MSIRAAVPQPRAAASPWPAGKPPNQRSTAYVRRRITEEMTGSERSEPSFLFLAFTGVDAHPDDHPRTVFLSRTLVHFTSRAVNGCERLHSKPRRRFCRDWPAAQLSRPTVEVRRSSSVNLLAPPQIFRAQRQFVVVQPATLGCRLFSP